MQERDSELAVLRIEQKKLVKALADVCDASTEASQEADVKIEEMQQVGLERDKLLQELKELRHTHETHCLSQAVEHDEMIAEVSIRYRFL